MAPTLQNTVKLCSDGVINNITCLLEAMATANETANDPAVKEEAILDYEDLNVTSTTPPFNHEDHIRRLTEFHIIKAVVLSAVTLVILLSICKMVFGMVLKYPGGKTDT